MEEENFDSESEYDYESEYQESSESEPEQEPNDLLDKFGAEELPKYKMTTREEETFKVLAIKDTEPTISISETERIFQMRKYLTDLVITDNPSYQRISFGARRLAELMYGVSY